MPKSVIFQAENCGGFLKKHRIAGCKVTLTSTPTVSWLGVAFRPSLNSRNSPILSFIPGRF